MTTEHAHTLYSRRSMNWFFTVLLVSISSFVAANIDDIIILILFFSQVNEKFRPRHIIIGQYLGFTALILASLPGLIGGLIIPKTWIGLLGLVPIVIGIKQLLDREEDEEPTIQNISTNAKSSAPFFSRFLNSKIYSVAAVTVANGGDNIGIYVPLFASGSWLNFGITITVFYCLIGVWCSLAYLLTRQPLLAKSIARYGHGLFPFVLIGLGLFILIESKSYQILNLFD